MNQTENEIELTTKSPIEIGFEYYEHQLQERVKVAVFRIQQDIEWLINVQPRAALGIINSLKDQFDEQACIDCEKMIRSNMGVSDETEERVDNTEADHSPI